MTLIVFITSPDGEIESCDPDNEWCHKYNLLNKYSIMPFYRVHATMTVYIHNNPIIIGEMIYYKQYVEQ